MSPYGTEILKGILSDVRAMSVVDYEALYNQVKDLPDFRLGAGVGTVRVMFQRTTISNTTVDQACFQVQSSEIVKIDLPSHKLSVDNTYSLAA